MEYTIIDALISLKPKAEWALDGYDYSGLTWLDKNQTKPTEAEIEEKLAELKYQGEINVYQEKRKLEYPNWEDQLDKIYHSGVDAWKTDIKAIKDKYPKQTMDATELQKRKDAAVFEMKKRYYETAVARLAQYELSAGLKDEEGKHIIMPIAIEINGERNPLVVADELERTEAQKVIDNTPQAVIESVSSSYYSSISKCHLICFI